MSAKRLFLTIALVTVSTAAWAQDFGLDVGSLSDPLTGTPVFVNGAGGGAFGYYNSTDSLITELSFVINAGTTDLSHFSCTPYSFFSECLVSQSGNILTLDFRALSPADGDEDPFHSDPESRETEGIPTLMDGCAAHPDSGYSNPLPLEDDRTFACISRGHFLISFNTPSEGNALSNPNGFGGWATDGSVSASIATVNGVPVPEPASAVWFAAGLLVLAGFRRRYAHSAQISARYRVRPGR